MHATADRLEVYDDIMGFFWSCANAFPILTLVPGFLLPSVISLSQPNKVSHQADKRTGLSVP